MIKVDDLRYFGKYLDQPALVKKMHKYVPYGLGAGALTFGLIDTFTAPEEQRKNKFVHNLSVLTLTVASALIATRGLKIKGKQVLNGLVELPHLHSKELDNTLLKITDDNARQLALKVKDNNVLSFKQVKELAKNLETKFNDKKLIDTIIPEPHNHKPFEELKDLSLLGLIPVVGGVTGGIIGDKLTTPDWKSKVPNKIKEGSYQYLNNIFLCNVGAGAALLLMNKLNVKSKSIRFASMMAGVVSVGLLAGSTIANLFGQKIINPIFDKKEKNNKDSKPISFKELNKERHPELLDLSLHVDDLASVGFLSGLKWIGPILPVMYSISGYRAGIGYRNHHKHGKD